MKCDRLAACVAALLALAVWSTASPPAIAGDADHEITDDHEDGASYFGEAKDVAGLKPLDAVHVKAQIKGTMRFLIGQTDEDGRFKIRGLGPEIDPENVVVSCEKAGYRVVDTIRRRLSTDPVAPIEVECLLEKSGGKASR